MALSVAPDGLDAVVFDMGGVFVLPEPRVVAAALADAGLAVPADPDQPEGRAAYRRAHYAAMRHHDAVRPDDPDIGVHYVAAYLTGLGVASDELDEAVATTKVMWDRPADERWTWRQPGSAEALAALAHAGYGVAVVSNCDGTAEAILTEAGVCQVGPGPATPVAAIVDSHLVGVAKPDPAVFAPALAALGVAPHRAVFVGDSLRYDVAGARAAGLHPVHLAPGAACAERDHDCIDALDDLVDHLVR